MKTKKEIRLLILLIPGTFFSLAHINSQTGLPESEHYNLEKLADK